MNDNEKFLSLVILCCIVAYLFGDEVDKVAYLVASIFFACGLIGGRIEYAPIIGN
jgi:hypothetical protein